MLVERLTGSLGSMLPNLVRERMKLNRKAGVSGVVFNPSKIFNHTLFLKIPHQNLIIKILHNVLIIKVLTLTHDLDIELNQ